MEIWVEMMERVFEVNKKAFHESEAANFGGFSSEFNLLAWNSEMLMQH